MLLARKCVGLREEYQKAALTGITYLIQSSSIESAENRLKHRANKDAGGFE